MEKERIIYDCGLIFFSRLKQDIEDYDKKFSYWYTNGNFSKLFNHLFSGKEMQIGEEIYVLFDTTALGYERNFTEDFPIQLVIKRIFHEIEIAKVGSNSFVYRKVYRLAEI